MYRARLGPGQHQGYGQHAEQGLPGHQEDLQEGKNGPPQQRPKELGASAVGVSLQTAIPASTGSPSPDGDDKSNLLTHGRTEALWLRSSFQTGRDAELHEVAFPLLAARTDRKCDAAGQAGNAGKVRWRWPIACARGKMLRLVLKLLKANFERVPASSQPGKVNKEPFPSLSSHF